MEFDELPGEVKRTLKQEGFPGEGGEIRPRHLPRLLRWSLDADTDVQLRILSAVNRLCGRDPTFREPLLDGLSDCSFRERTQRFRALENRGDDAICRRLSPFMKDPGPRVRYHLVGVCRGEYTPCLDTLQRGAADHRRDVAARAARVLAGAGTEEARRRAIECYRTETRPLVKIAYLRTFTQDGNPRFAPLASEELDRDGDPRVRFHAACLLKYHQPRNLAKRAENDPYLKRIQKRIPVNE